MADLIVVGLAVLGLFSAIGLPILFGFLPPHIK